MLAAVMSSGGGNGSRSPRHCASSLVRMCGEASGQGRGLVVGSNDAIVVGVEAFFILFHSLMTSEQKKTKNAN